LIGEKSMDDARLNITYTEAVMLLQCLKNSIDTIKEATEIDGELYDLVISVSLVKEQDERYVNHFPNAYVIEFLGPGEGSTSIIVPDDDVSEFKTPRAPGDAK
jgi:hypothetical protein